MDKVSSRLRKVFPSVKSRGIRWCVWSGTAISEKMLFADGVRKTCTGADILLPAREAGFNRPFLILQSAVGLVVLLFICG